MLIIEIKEKKGVNFSYPLWGGGQGNKI